MSTTTIPRINGDDEPYWLGRATEEQQRLIKQHHTWTKSIGHLLPPQITTTLPPTARIADVGTGTGIWLSSLSTTSPPTHSFTGFDISPDQFLPAASLPPNVHLRIADFKKPFPDEFLGAFDVVNVRLVIIAMGEGVWEPTLRNVLTLLRPGGAVCWTEGNFLVARGFRGEGGGSSCGHALTRAQVQLNTSLTRRFGFNFPEWVPFFEGAGLVGVEEDVLSTDRLVEQRRDFTEIGVGAVLGGLANMAKSLAGQEGVWSVEETEEARRKAIEDMESGAYFRWDLHVTIGFTKK